MMIKGQRILVLRPDVEEMDVHVVDLCGRAEILCQKCTHGMREEAPAVIRGEVGGTVHLSTAFTICAPRC